MKSRPICLALLLFSFAITTNAQNRPMKIYRPSEVLSYLSIVERTDAHSIRFTGKDMIEVSKFLEFVVTYDPALEP